MGERIVGNWTEALVSTAKEGINNNPKLNKNIGAHLYQTFSH